MINPKYVPSTLSRKDRKHQIKMIQKSQQQYRQHRYVTRQPLTSFLSRRSPHLRRATQMYHVPSLRVTKQLVTNTRCRRSALQSIIRKGQGAYYSSGSRPNQTPQSWGIARLASALTGGNASLVDIDILRKGCHPHSTARRLAEKRSSSSRRQRSLKIKKN